LRSIRKLMSNERRQAIKLRTVQVLYDHNILGFGKFCWAELVCWSLELPSWPDGVRALWCREVKECDLCRCDAYTYCGRFRPFEVHWKYVLSTCQEAYKGYKYEPGRKPVLDSLVSLEPCPRLRAYKGCLN